MLPTSPHREGYARRRRRLLYLRLVVGVLFIAVIVGALSYVAHLGSLRISTVKLSGGVLVTEDEMSREVKSDLSGSYFWLFPRNNIFLYPRAALLRDISAKFPRIETISASVNFAWTDGAISRDGQILDIHITERHPFALWCDSDALDHCYFMDDQGTIFAEAPNFSGDAYFKYTGSLATDTPIGGQYMSSTTEFQNISDFIAGVRSLDLHPQYVARGDGGDLTLGISGGGKIYFDTRDPLAKTLDNLRVLLHTPALTASSSPDLPVDYIDLRYGNKLYYKFK